MHEVDNETWSRSIVATLGLGIVGASREGRGNTPMVPPQHYPLVGLRRSFASVRDGDRAPARAAPGGPARRRRPTVGGAERAGGSIAPAGRRPGAVYRRGGGIAAAAVRP